MVEPHAEAVNVGDDLLPREIVVDRDHHIVRRMPLQRDAPVIAFVLGAVLLVNILLREPADHRLAIAGVGIGGAFGVAGWRATGRSGALQLARRVIAALPAVHADTVGVGIAARVDEVGQHAERAIGKGVAQQHAAGRNDLARAILDRARNAGRQTEPRMIERLGKFDIDGRADRARGQRYVGRLEDAQAADEIGTDGREIDLAVAGRGRDPTTIIQRGVEVAAKAADGDAGGFAACARTLDRHARQALQRGRDVRIGEFADVFGRDGVDHASGRTLDVEVALERAAQTRDDNVLADLVGGGGVGRRSSLRRYHLRGLDILGVAGLRCSRVCQSEREQARSANQDKFAPA
ncbi:hypothetical protein D9M73_128920 [compost metagenome]